MPHILIIDDNHQLRGLCRRVLEEGGFTVAEAADGAAGIELFREQPACAILCDLFMPVKDGFETIIELRRECPSVKIIAMTGEEHSLKFNEVAKRLGAVGALVKPFHSEELLSLVHLALAHTVHA